MRQGIRSLALGYLDYLKYRNKTMTQTLPYIEIGIPISREEYIFHQRHLLNSIEYEQYDCEGTVDFYDIDVGEDYNVTLYIRNAKTEDGGPYIDPVLFRKVYLNDEDYNLYEDCVGDVLDDLDSSISFIIYDKEYNFGITVVDKEQ